jgi:hypothetical protein
MLPKEFTGVGLPVTKFFDTETRNVDRRQKKRREAEASRRQ